MVITSISGFSPGLMISGKVFVFTYFFWLRAFSDRSTLKMENIPVSESQFQKNELWWVLVSPEVGLATSPLNWAGRGVASTGTEESRLGAQQASMSHLPSHVPAPLQPGGDRMSYVAPDVVRRVSELSPPPRDGTGRQTLQLATFPPVSVTKACILQTPLVKPLETEVRWPVTSSFSC